MRSLPFLLVLAACGWSEDRFLVEGIPAFCAQAADCVGFDPGACEDAVRAVDRGKCDYDPKAARACARHLEDEGTCRDNGDLGTYSYLPPAACDAVWPGCGPLFEPPIDEGTSPPPTTGSD